MTEIFKIKDKAKNQKRYRYFFVWVYIENCNENSYFFLNVMGRFGKFLWHVNFKLCVLKYTWNANIKPRLNLLWTSRNSKKLQILQQISDFKFFSLFSHVRILSLFCKTLELWVNFDHEWGLRGTFKTFTLSVTVNVMLVQFLSITPYDLLVLVFHL